MIVGLIGHNGIGLSKEVLYQLYAKGSCKTGTKIFLFFLDTKNFEMWEIGMIIIRKRHGK